MPKRTATWRHNENSVHRRKAPDTRGDTSSASHPAAKKKKNKKNFISLTSFSAPRTGNSTCRIRPGASCKVATRNSGVHSCENSRDSLQLWFHKGTTQGVTIVCAPIYEAEGPCAVAAHFSLSANAA